MKLWQNLIVWAIGGLLYVSIEILFRGWSHPSMFLVGGLCFLAIGMLDQAAPGMPLLAQAFLGAGIITALELVSGLIVNVGLGLNVWDYSHHAYNYKGQICLGFSLLWVPMSLAAVFADDAFRKFLFAQPIPDYRWF